LAVSAAAGSRWLLLDKSAIVRIDALPEDSALGEPCLCAITRLELLYSARSRADYARIEQELAAFHELRIDAETIATAVAAHRELAQRGRHRLPLPDLLIAACAQQHQAGVLHVDRHFDVLAEVLTFEAIRASVD
jgi:predicted nucleic acid-binding protein